MLVSRLLTLSLRLRTGDSLKAGTLSYLALSPAPTTGLAHRRDFAFVACLPEGRQSVARCGGRGGEGRLCHLTHSVHGEYMGCIITSWSWIFSEQSWLKEKERKRSLSVMSYSW